MKFTVAKGSDWDYEAEVEIETLEELIKFIKECDEAIVIERDCKRITIYDDCLE